MPNPSAEITLSTSRTLGLVAIASGDRYQQANHALAEAGFSRLPNGAYTASLADAQAARHTASALLHRAHEHGATVIASTRPYLGDFGAEIAAQLPGTWSAELEIYSHPLWQEDLWPALWEAGEIHRAIEDHRIPFASVLKNGTGTELLLIERPGHPSGYLLGALTDHEKEDVRNDPATPRSFVLPAAPGLAASAISHTFLPAYRRALHNRDVNSVLSALERIREEHQTLQAIKDSGRYSDGVPLKDPRLLAGFERGFADQAWLSFHDVLEHAPGLLTRCRPAATPWPEDAAALVRLREAVANCQDVWNQWNDLRRDPWAPPPGPVTPRVEPGPRAARPRRPAGHRSMARPCRRVRAPGPSRRTGRGGGTVRAQPAATRRPHRAAAVTPHGGSTPLTVHRRDFASV